MSIASFLAAAVLAVSLPLSVGCAGAPIVRSEAPPPGRDEIRNMTFHGIAESGGPIRLKDGRWEGASFVEGGASHPTVELVDQAPFLGDLDGDGVDEAVVMLHGSSGGSGANLYLAVVGRRDGRAENLGTALLGDRVQVRRVTMEGRLVRMDLVQAEPSDPACCPGGLFSRTFALSDGALVEPAPAIRTGRLGLAVLEDRVWLLREWSIGEPAPASPSVTLTFQEGRLAGDAGCNRYFATVKAEDLPGAIDVGPTGSTRMACDPSRTEVESRYLALLGGVTRFGFLFGRLALSYRTDAGSGTMLFEATP